MNFIYQLYGTFGEPHPILSCLILGLVGALLFGGTWLAIGKLHKKFINENVPIVDISGKGGGAYVEGNNSGAIGGKGGQGGVGPGGDGGNAHVLGNNSFAKGGDGGNAAQPDGRGGRRTQGPTENMNFPTDTWRFGYGGAGANVPEYDRRLKLLIQIRNEYKENFPDDIPFIDAGIDRVSLDWVNKRLEEMGEAWRVTAGPNGYILPPL